MAYGIAAILIAISVIVLSYRKYVVKYFTDRWDMSKIPTIDEIAYPIIGHTYLFDNDPAIFFKYICDLAKQEIKKKNAKFVAMWLGPLPFIIIVHPDAAETILKSSKHMEKSFVYTFLHPWLGTGLLTANGGKWFQRRRLITPSFHFSILQEFLGVMNDRSKELISKLKNLKQENKEIDLSKCVALCALDIICETAMGKSVDAQKNEDSTYVKALYRLAELIQYRQKSPLVWPDFVFNRTACGKEQKQLLVTLHSFTQSVIRDRINENKIKESDIQNENTEEYVPKKRRLAFMDVLLEAKTTDGEKLSFSGIQEEVDTFMFEGHDTTAAAMTWALYLLGRNPDVQRRVQEEIDDVIGVDDVDRPFTMDDLASMQYLGQVVKETLRMFPSVPMFARVMTEDCELDGYKVPKGTQVTVLPYSLHHNPQVWDDPEKFDPDRFSKENVTNRHPFAYLPFSAGPRNCVGQRFAIMEEKVILAQILRNFDVSASLKREDLSLIGELILRPANPIGLSIKDRVKVE